MAWGSRPAMPLPPIEPHDPYRAALYEQPSPLGFGPGDAWATMPPPGGVAQGIEQHLWTAFVLAKPVMSGARLLLPYLQRLGGRRLAAAGASAALALAEAIAYGRASGQRGTAQGGSLSPLLANTYLHPFDLALTSQGLRLVRFMDDFVIMCASQAEAEQVLSLARRQLATLRLALNEEKTRVANYADGLEFLGQVLAPRQSGARLAQGARTFGEAQEALQKAAGDVRRQVRQRIKR